MNPTCPVDPEEIAEALYLGHLDAAAAASFLAHMGSCRKCQRVYEQTVQFVDAMRAAALKHPDKS